MQSIIALDLFFMQQGKVDRTFLIELKLASGLTAPDRLKDLADVQELIRTLNLPESLAGEIDESVRSEYLKLYRRVQPRRE